MQIVVHPLLLLLLFLFFIYLMSRGRYRKKHQLLEKEKELAVKQTQISAAIESQESERKRFAQDLHDGFGQLISSLRIFIGQIQKSNDLATKADAFEKSEKVLEEMHREIRNIAFNLMPATLIQLGVVAALREFGQRLTQTGTVKVSVDAFDMGERLTELQEISLYRVVQEWVNNILKYAGAKRIDIQLIKHENELLLMIEDDGKGFDTAILTENKGNGWRNINSRLSRINAKMVIDSNAVAKGTMLEISIPISDKWTVDVKPHLEN